MAGMNRYHVQIVEPFICVFDTYGHNVEAVFERIQKDNPVRLLVRIWEDGEIGQKREPGGSWVLEKWTTPQTVSLAVTPKG